MSDRIHVTMELELFVEDAGAMRESAFERLQGAWSSDEDFPYESAADVPLDEVVHSILADALRPDLPGCRRSQLKVEVEDRSEDGGDTSSRDEANDSDGSAADGEKPAPEGGSTDESSHHEDQAETSKGDDNHGAP